jgi:hypothetical protein
MGDLQGTAGKMPEAPTSSPGSDRAIQYAGASRLLLVLSEVPDRPPEPVIGHAEGDTRSGTMTPTVAVRTFRISRRVSRIETHLRLPATHHARGMSKQRALDNRGRRKGRELAAPMARLQKKMQAAGTTGSAETSRPSLREWVTDYTRSPQGPAFLPLSLATLVESIANLTPAPGCQDHTTSPSASMPYVNRHQRVHRSPPPRS